MKAVVSFYFLLSLSMRFLNKRTMISPLFSKKAIWVDAPVKERMDSNVEVVSGIWDLHYSIRTATLDHVDIHVDMSASTRTSHFQRAIGQLGIFCHTIPFTVPNQRSLGKVHTDPAVDCFLLTRNL